MKKFKTVDEVCDWCCDFPPRFIGYFLGLALAFPVLILINLFYPFFVSFVTAIKYLFIID